MNSVLRSTSLSLHGIEDAHYHLGSPVDFTAEGRGAFHTDSCWGTPDNYGTWTLGPEASLIMYLGELPPDKRGERRIHHFGCNGQRAIPQSRRGCVVQ